MTCAWNASLVGHLDALGIFSDFGGSNDGNNIVEDLQVKSQDETSVQAPQNPNLKPNSSPKLKSCFIEFGAGRGKIIFK